MTRLRSLIKEVLSQPKKKDCNCGCNDCGGKAPILTEGKVKHLISEGLQYHIDKKIQLHESVYRIGSEKHFELIREARALWVRGIIDVSEDDQAILETNLGHFGMYEGEAVPLDMPMVNEEKAITFRPGTLSDMELATKILDREGIKYKIDNFDLVLSDEDYLVVLDYLKGRNNRNVNLSTSILNEEAKMPSQEEVDKFFSITQNEMHYLNSKPVMGQKGDRVRNEIEPWDEYDLSNWNALVRRAKAQGKLNKDYNPDQEQLRDEEEIFMPMDDEGLPLEEKKKAKPKKKDPPIGKPKRGGSKAYYVYVRDPKTKRIKKVSFGSGGLRAKIRNPKARNAFAKRHRCSEKNDRTKPSYWSCRLPRYAKQLGLGANMNTFW